VGAHFQAAHGQNMFIADFHGNSSGHTPQIGP
jgi:hypothetical protein